MLLVPSVRVLTFLDGKGKDRNGSDESLIVFNHNNAEWDTTLTPFP